MFQSRDDVISCYHVRPRFTNHELCNMERLIAVSFFLRAADGALYTATRAHVSSYRSEGSRQVTFFNFATSRTEPISIVPTDAIKKECFSEGVKMSVANGWREVVIEGMFSGSSLARGRMVTMEQMVKRHTFVHVFIACSECIRLCRLAPLTG